LFRGEFSPFCEKYFEKKEILSKIPCFLERIKRIKRKINCQNHLKYEKGA
jgi:hypothetical protein